MVTFGFITEGESEKKVLDSPAFREFLKKEKIAFVPEIINAKGSGQLLPHNRDKYSKRLKSKGATHIIILTDKEDAPCFSSVKERVEPDESETVLISAKAIESWFLADSSTLTKILRQNFNHNSPENLPKKPYEVIKDEFSKRGKDCDDKLILADRMIRNGFSVENAAAHPNCNSAKYFINKLRAIASIKK